MLPYAMLSSQSSQSPSSSPGFSPSVGLSDSAFSSFSSFCGGGSSYPRLSPMRRLPCQHDNPSSPAPPPDTSHQPQVTNSFIIRTYEKHACNPFGIRTYKTQDLKLFRMNTYRKTPGGYPRPFTQSRDGSPLSGVIRRRLGAGSTGCL